MLKRGDNTEMCAEWTQSSEKAQEQLGVDTSFL